MFGAHFHVYLELHYHLVLVTKYRKRVITSEVFNSINNKTLNLFQSYNIQLNQIGGESDHIHLEFKAHPSLDISKLVNSLKTITSREVRKEFPEVRLMLRDGFWSRAYFIKTIGNVDQATVVNYINNHQF